METGIIDYKDTQQIDYIKKVRDIIKDKNLSYSILTMGCQLNENDSEKIEGMLSDMGYTYTDDYLKADIVIYNTCCVRENAEERLFGKIGEIKKIKEERDVILAIGGCMMQEKAMLDKIKQSYSFVDIIFGTHTMQNLPEYIYKYYANKKKIREVIDIDGEIYEGLPVKRMDKFKASVTIMYGCNNFCTYCIVPYVRGRERSREPERILSEVEQLAKEGYKEITLLGQNVNSYKGNDKIKNFADLLNELCKIEGIERVRFISPHPKDFTDDVIEAIANNEKVCKIIHLPMQSGSTKVLKAMNRKYSKEQYLELAQKMLDRIPGLVLSTDIIVGFPGETEEDFEDTLDVVRRINFEQIYMFIYSIRQGTIAENMEQVPEDVKHKRFDRLKELYDSQVDDNNEKYLGTIQKVLVDGPSKNNEDMFEGRTDTNKVVIFKATEDYIGKIANVEIVEAHKWYLKGGRIMDEYPSLDTAIEIMAYKMAACTKLASNDETYREELERLRNERDQMYNGNMEIINKIIKEYGKDIFEQRNKIENS